MTTEADEDGAAPAETADGAQAQPVAAVQDEATAASKAAPPIERRGPRRGRVWMWIAAAVAVVALVVAATWLTVLQQLGAAEDADRAAAIGAARQVVVALTTTTPGGARDSFEQLRELATGPFGEQLQTQSTSFVSAIQSGGVTSQGSVTGSAYVSGDSQNARIIVVSDSVVRNNQVPQGEPRQYRMQLDMTKQGERWLVSNLDFVA